MGRTGNHYENMVMITIQGRIIVLVHSLSSYTYLFTNYFSFQSLLYFSRYVPDRQHL